ncbi:MAG: hypothetical protein WKF67_13550 [Rubrobacteraceae bacterium]
MSKSWKLLFARERARRVMEGAAPVVYMRVRVFLRRRPGIGQIWQARSCVEGG